MAIDCPCGIVHEQATGYVECSCGLRIADMQPFHYDDGEVRVVVNVPPGTAMMRAYTGRQLTDEEIERMTARLLAAPSPEEHARLWGLPSPRKSS